MNWYVNGATGNDSTGTGTAALPYATMTPISPAPGDVIFLADKVRGSVTFNSPVGVTVCQWPGQTKYDLRGAFVASGWSASGGGYVKTIATGLTVKGVVCDWDTNIDANGLHYGHLTPAADAATALSTLNNWHYNSGTGILSINIGANPASHVLEYCVGGAGVAGIGFTDADGLNILDFRASLWVGYKWNEAAIANSGQAIRGHGRNITITVDRVDDCGYHHICVADGVCSNNVIQPSQKGLGRLSGVNNNGIPLVFHTANSSQTGNEARDLTIWATPLLKRDGTPVSTSHTISACYSHSSGGVKFDGVTWRNLHIRYPYAVGVSSTPVSAGDTTAPSSAANSRLIANYGVQVVDCKVDGDHAQGCIVTASVAFQRCHLHFGSDRIGAGSSGWFTDNGDDATKYTLFDACEILINQGTGSTGASEGIRLGTNAGMVFLNTSVAMWGVRTAECRMFSLFAATQTLYARQSIFGFPDATAGTRKLIHGDSWDQTGTPRNFDNCAYVRITGFGYSANTSYWTPALWLSAVDTHAQQFASTNVFEEPFTGQPMSHARLSRAGSTLWGYANTGIAPHTDIGINLKPWTGTPGCYQYGAGPAFSSLN